MQSKAPTVAEYLASLPPDRRAALEKLRAVINENIDPTFREGMGYGMMGWSVPHSVFPDGYHCTPELPLPFAGLASQKQHMSLYMMGLYIGEGGEPEIARWFRTAWTKTGRKLDMGKSCIRFKRIEDVPLDVVAEAFRRQPAQEYIARYVAVRDGGKTTKVSSSGAAKKKAVAKSAAPAKKATANRVAAKPAAARSKKTATKKKG